jgi:hypothetical protein
MSELINFEKRIPRNVDEAMEELDRRIQLASIGELSHKLNIRIIVRDLIQDLVKGLENRSTIHIL